ncbi:MAG: hypothetical protein HC796_07620 [Synechococcaceae cyanobacterium RL_1_2]|nr:hypothetical protein [Synechococcaceae cyanobacterium RL_1_2]
MKNHRLFDWSGAEDPLREFINRPGVLFIMAILYRDGLINPQLFKCSLVEMQFQFYGLLWQWLLGKPLCHHLPEIVKDGMAHSYRTNAIASTLVGDRDPP